MTGERRRGALATSGGVEKRMDKTTTTEPTRYGESFSMESQQGLVNYFGRIYSRRQQRRWRQDQQANALCTNDIQAALLRWLSQLLTRRRRRPRSPEISLVLSERRKMHLFSSLSSLIWPYVILVVLVLCFQFPMTNAQESDPPSVAPTRSQIPSLSSIPTTSPTVSKAPSPVPSSVLSSSSPTASKQPSLRPTQSPQPTRSEPTSTTPTQTNAPSTRPSVWPSSSPTISHRPSATPTVSGQPSSFPTFSLRPSATPTSVPSISAPPSQVPSPTPSDVPSLVPSDAPTSIPTFSVPFEENRSFRMELVLSEQSLNNTAKEILANLYESYTELFHPAPERVSTKCIVTSQIPFPCDDGDDECIVGNSTEPDTTLFLSDVDLSCTWTSVVTEVIGSAESFEAYVDDNPEEVLADIQELQLPVEKVLGLRLIPEDPPTSSPTISPQPTTLSPTIEPTGTPTSSANPTITPQPTDSPTQSSKPTTSPPPSLTPSSTPTKSFSPTVSSHPSSSPVVSSESPSVLPSQLPSTLPSLPPSRAPTLPPTLPPTVKPPTNSPTPRGGVNGVNNPENVPPGDSGGNAAVIASVIVVVSFLVIAALFVWFWRRKNNAPSTFFKPNEVPMMDPGYKGGPTAMELWGIPPPATKEHEIMDAPVIVSPNNSVLSRQSLLSAGGSGLGDGSDLEADDTKNLQDEFDQYKDQNLEQLRSDVEDKVSGFEGIMSAAVTKALMGDEYPQEELPSEIRWGCATNASGPEIEASALCEVSDWLKRTEDASELQKRSFMQDILNRMVSSVRFGLLPAEDASRTIHESVALLGLQLAHQLPMTTIIISGMRKTTTASHIKAVLREFGDLDTVAVASGQRGFGIVRFRNPKSVDRVMRRYRSGEIVIQDVAIQMKFLTPSGQVDSGKR